MEGRLCRVEPLDPARHAENLFAAYSADKEGRNWTYMGYGPFASPAALREWMEKSCLGADPLFHAVVDRRSNKALGVASSLRIDPPTGVIEVGHLHFTPALQGHPMPPQPMYRLMPRFLPQLAYRPHPAKATPTNAPPQQAA